MKRFWFWVYWTIIANFKKRIQKLELIVYLLKAVTLNRQRNFYILWFYLKSNGSLVVMRALNGALKVINRWVEKTNDGIKCGKQVVFRAILVHKSFYPTKNNLHYELFFNSLLKKSISQMRKPIFYFYKLRCGTGKRETFQRQTYILLSSTALCTFIK